MLIEKNNEPVETPHLKIAQFNFFVREQMNKQKEMKNFYKLVTSEFTLDAKQADKVYRELGFDKEDKAYYIWFECFAEVTNMLMKENDKDNVLKHFSFFTSYLNNGTDVIKNCIDVSYIENLFWKVDKETSELFWPLLPKQMQELYIDFHGLKPTE